MQRGEIFRRTSLFPDRRRRPGGHLPAELQQEKRLRDYQDHKRNASKLPVIVGGPDCILHPRPIPGTVLTVACEAEKVIVEVVDAVLAGKRARAAARRCVPRRVRRGEERKALLLRG